MSKDIKFVERSELTEYFENVPTNDEIKLPNEDFADDSKKMAHEAGVQPSELLFEQFNETTGSGTSSTADTTVHEDEAVSVTRTSSLV